MWSERSLLNLFVFFVFKLSKIQKFKNYANDQKIKNEFYFENREKQVMHDIGIFN